MSARSLGVAQPLTRIRRADENLMSAYARHCAGLGLAACSVEDRLAGAEAFLARHPDLAAWMTRPLPARLTDLKRFTFAWPLVSFAILTGHIRADFDLLAAKHAGRGFAGAVAAIYPDDVAALRAAATRLDWAEDWTKAVLGHGLPLVVAATARAPLALSAIDIEAVRDEVRASPHYTYSTRRSRLSHLHSLTRLLYEARVVDMPPIHRRGDGPGDLPSRLAHVTAPAIREAMLAWLRAKQAVVKVSSIRDLASHLAAFGEYLSEHHPELTSLTQLDRHHIEAFCTWVPTRHWRGQRASEQRIGIHSVIKGLVAVRGFLDDISAWGWAEAPARRLMFASDIPRPPRQLPRALSPDIDAALMTAVAELPDRFARIGLTVLRGAGLRIGELLDLEFDCVVDYGPAGVWLRVPLGKLNSERSVPLDEATIAAITEWKSQRGIQRALPHQRDGRMVDFLFVERGRRPGAARIERGLRHAVRAAGLVGPDGAPLHVTAHQLRHTYATAFANAGMSIQAIMALLGHTTPEMTLRYATLASPTLRNAYQTAMGRMRPRLPLAPVGKPLLPDKVEWLNAEMLKTRLASGFCARELAADACPYANICETCDNFVTSDDFLPALRDQLNDLHALREDAAARGWDSEAARHQRVITSLESHVRRLETPRRAR
jgi:integrase